MQTNFSKLDFKKSAFFYDFSNKFYFVEQTERYLHEIDLFLILETQCIFQ